MAIREGMARRRIPTAGGLSRRIACLPAILPAGLLLTLAGCHGADNDRPVVVDLIGRPVELASPQRHDTQPAAQVVLGATAQGLVGFDATGEVVAALAESWIVADGGQSYIFRLARAKWPNGEPVKADLVARLLQQRMRASPDLMAGLRPEVRAMTDRVIEIRLETALPALLQLLAQPRLGIAVPAGGTGPMTGRIHQRRLYLQPVPDQLDMPDDGTLPEIRPADRRTLETDRPAMALIRYLDGKADIVLGGRFQHLLLIPQVRLGATDVRADPVPGLFGLALGGTAPLLADAAVRDALSRAIDRAQLATALNLQGWTTAVTPIPAQLDLARPPTLPAWSGDPIATRTAAARAAVARWRSAHGDPPMLRIALPEGAGATLLFFRLAADYARIGLRLDRVGMDEPADLRLIDEVAAFDSALWYLSRIDCGARILCDPAASEHLSAARETPSLSQQSEDLSDAEALIVAHGGYIPLGLPIRWSLVSRRLTGFAPSPRGIHPLNLLIARPN